LPNGSSRCIPGPTWRAFQRCGGEACAVAIRIARAATRKSAVAICGYHGWSDWYPRRRRTSAMPRRSTVSLLPGLDPGGVPRELKGTALTFNYNRLDELEAIVNSNSDRIGAIIMEPMRASAPAPASSRESAEIATKLGAVSDLRRGHVGLRVNNGGIHLTMGVEPDMAVFGKALGMVPYLRGDRPASVMDYAQESFISSTMWTERIGPVAALATLDKIVREDVPRTSRRTVSASTPVGANSRIGTGCRFTSRESRH